MIYFVQAIEGGPIKIGFSDCVDRRIKQLASHYGKPLELLAVMDGDREGEQAIHEKFSHLRFGRTEQFRPAFELMEFIGLPLLVDANPDAIEAMEPQCAFTLVRISDEVAQIARELAPMKGMSMAELLSDTLKPILEKMRDDEMRKRLNKK